MKSYKAPAMAFLLGLLLQFTTTQTVYAQDSVERECVPQAEVQEISKHFRQFEQFAGADFCNDDSQSWHLLSSIVFMRQTKFDDNMTPSQDELFTGRFAKSWYDYFIGRIDELSVVSSCPKGVIAYVYMFGDKTMYTCPAALTKTFSSLDRASVMMHEARHIDGFPHMTCTRGARKGRQGACDRRISEGGSYAVTVETYAQLAKYAKGIHPALKAYAKSSAVLFADEAFEAPVRVDRSASLLLVTKSLDFHSYAVDSGEFKKLGKLSDEGHIIKRGHSLVLFPNDKNLKAGYVFENNEGTIEQSPSDFITEYNQLAADKKAELVDLHIGAVWQARVYKNNIAVLCDPYAPNSAVNLAMPAGQVAQGLLYPEGYARDTYSAQVLAESGEVYDLGCVNKQARMTPATTRLDQRYKRIYKTGGQTLGLSNDGKLFKLEAGRSSVVTTGLNGSITEIVPQEGFRFF